MKKETSLQETLDYFDINTSNEKLVKNITKKIKTTIK